VISERKVFMGEEGIKVIGAKGDAIKKTR